MPPAPKALPAEAKGCSLRWDACGGIDWRGPGCCAGENTCEPKDTFYSQCLPRALPVDVQRQDWPCGGAGHAGPTKCEALTTCVVVDTNLSLCKSIFPAPEGAGSASAPLGPDGCAVRYAPCDGVLGKRCCAAGNDCVMQNPWYSQCLPAAVPAGTKRRMESCGSAAAPEPCEVGTECTPVNAAYSICQATVPA